MTRHLRSCLACTAVLAVSYAISLPAGAQTPQYSIKMAPPGGPAPRSADGHPDLTGVWWPNRAGLAHAENRSPTGRSGIDPASLRHFDPRVTPEEPPSFQPWAAEKIKGMTATERELQKLSVNCIPRGLPAIWLSNTYAHQLIQTPGQLVQLIEVLNNFRVIHTDGRPHSKYPDPLFHGESRGRWEGDTLVIDSISFDERTFVNNSGTWFHSDQMHVIERITRPSKNYLVVQVTVEDPKVLTKPWTSAPRNWTLIDEDINEYYCTDNPDVSEFQKLKAVESQGK